MKKISRLQVTAWVLSLLPAAMTAVFYSRLPAEIPMQWDLAGHMNYETRWHLWIVAGMAPLFAVLFYFLPRFDPKSKNYDKFSDAYIGFQIMIDLFLTAMCGICIAEALRPGTVDVPTVVCLLVSLLVMCLGNIMPKFRMTGTADSKRRGRCRAKLSGRKHIVWRAACCLRRVLSVRQARSFRTKLQSLCWCLRQWRRQRLSRLC